MKSKKIILTNEIRDSFNFMFLGFEDVLSNEEKDYFIGMLFFRIAEVLTKCRQSRCVEDAKCESEAVHI